MKSFLSDAVIYYVQIFSQFKFHQKQGVGTIVWLESQPL